MRLILNPEIDVLWRDKTTLQVRNPDGTNNTISDLPSEMKLIISSCTGIINISDILMNLNIDERIHEDINVALRFLIEHQILINQTQNQDSLPLVALQKIGKGLKECALQPGLDVSSWR